MNQVQSSQEYKGIWRSLVKMWSEEGWRGFFRGNGVNIVRIAPYSAVQFTGASPPVSLGLRRTDHQVLTGFRRPAHKAYEQFKLFLTRGGTVELNTPRRLTAGACAGICSVVSTYPVRVIYSTCVRPAVTFIRSYPSPRDSWIWSDHGCRLRLRRSGKEAQRQAGRGSGSGA